MYTGHGFYRDEAWTGTGTNFVLGPTLEALEPWREDLLIVEGIQNAPVPADLFGDAHNKAAPSLLTGGLIGSPSQGSEPGVNPHYAGGPSLDVVLGEILSAGAPVASIHLGVLATPPVSLPWLVSHRGLDELNLPYDDPGEAFDTLFAGVAPDPFLDQLSGSLVGFDATDPPATTEKQLELAAAAFTYDVTRVQLLSTDRAVPYIRWDALGYTDTMHTEMVQWPGPGDGGRSAYTYWAERLAGFLATLDATPDSNGGTLLEDTVVVWLSDMGSIPAAHTYNSIQVVIIDGSHTLATGQAIEVEATQADLSYTIAAALGVELEDFGAPSLDPAPIAELLAR